MYKICQQHTINQAFKYKIIQCIFWYNINKILHITTEHGPGITSYYKYVCTFAWSHNQRLSTKRHWIPVIEIYSVAIGVFSDIILWFDVSAAFQWPRFQKTGSSVKSPHPRVSQYLFYWMPLSVQCDYAKEWTYL